MTNFAKLKGRIVEKGYNLSSFSAILGMSRPCFRSRIEGKTEFKASEILKICSILGIEKHEIRDYFFCENVPKTDTIA